MVTVVIPLYNKAATIERAIRSVLGQTVQDFELRVVDNGSTDNGSEIVKKIDDPRIHLIVQDNQGVSMARNRGIAASNSEWVAFLDADDEWKPTFLATVLGLKDKYPGCSILATSYQRCNAKGEIADILLREIPESDDFQMGNYFEVASESDPPFCSISVMVKKEALLAVGGFPKGVHQGEDLLTWARLAVAYKIAYCRKPQSIFYTGETTGMDKPKRIPADNDIVGAELEKIHQSHPEITGLQKYIAKWHKMRASIYLRLPHQSSKCRNEIKAARKWYKDKKTTLYLLISFIPYPVRMKLIGLHH